MIHWLRLREFPFALESELERRYCQTFSTGFSSGAREGRKISVRFFVGPGVQLHNLWQCACLLEATCPPGTLGDLTVFRNRRSYVPRRSLMHAGTRSACM